MKFTYSWIKRYIDLKATPKEISDSLTMAGLEVVSIKKIGGDYLFEAEVTTNRPDCLGIIGIARELSAIFNKDLKLPSTEIKPSYMVRHKGDFSVSVIDKNACPRYTARIALNIRVAPSPEWLMVHIESIGLRPVNNIVDITNFCLFEFGQPLHAFDLDKLKGNRIIVRAARKGETIVTIDDARRTLDEDTLVIADEERPVAIAGIMGGIDTEVTDATKNILLESAYFEPSVIRRAARKLALKSESSYRFEREVAWDNVKRCSDRAILLIAEFAKGKISAKFFDKSKNPLKEKLITLSGKRVNKILGVDIPLDFMKGSLECLGFDVAVNKDTLCVSTNSLRKDIKEDIDLIEEIARLYGYDKIPSRIPKELITNHRADESGIRSKTHLAKDTMVSLGFNEVVSYSLISPVILEKLGTEIDETIIRIKNPASEEQAIMRPTLIGNLLGVASFNLNRKEALVNIFELGNIYRRQRGGFKEELYLAGVLCGTLDSGWREKHRHADFFDLKGALEELFSRLGIKTAEFNGEPRQILEGSSSCGIYINEKCIGLLGELRSEYLDRFDLKERLFIFEINFSAILDDINLRRHFSAIPKYPSIKRDISFVVDEKISSARIMQVIRSEASALIKEIRLFDKYDGGHIPPGKKSLAYSIEYRSNDRTLTDDEVNSLHSNIINTLRSELGAQAREK
jgi:phenylalanyl-tRNA synthetase beta chain